MNLENLTNEELSKLKEEIDIKLYSKNDFWNAIININNLEKKSNAIDERLISIKDNQPQLKKLNNLGFSLVIYDLDKVGLIMYEEQTVEGKFIGCSFKKLENKLNFENYEKPIQSKIDEVERILFIDRKENDDEMNTNNYILNQSNNSLLNRR